MEHKEINRGWVKNAAIIFLAVLLVLTFFSNTIMNRTLPEVATQSVTSGSITARVRGTGTVVANGSYQVKADQTREIRAVAVKTGQEVNQGDVLFILGQGDSDELEAATDALRDLEISYRKSAINMPTFDYTVEERKIASAQEKYDAVVNQRYLAVLAGVGVGVYVIWLAVGRPAGVSHADKPVYTASAVNHRAENLQAALGFLDLKPCALRQNGDARPIRSLITAFGAAIRGLLFYGHTFSPFFI